MKKIFILLLLLIMHNFANSFTLINNTESLEFEVQHLSIQNCEINPASMRWWVCILKKENIIKSLISHEIDWKNFVVFYAFSGNDLYKCMVSIDNFSIEVLNSDKTKIKVTDDSSHHFKVQIYPDEEIMKDEKEFGNAAAHL